MPKCGYRWEVKTEEDARLGLNMALRVKGLRPQVYTKEGNVFRVIRPYKSTGEQRGIYVVDKLDKGRFTRRLKPLSVRSMLGGEIDTQSSAERTHMRNKRKEYSQEVYQQEKGVRDLMDDLGEYDAEAAKRIHDSVGEIRSDMVGVGSRKDKHWAFWAKFKPARNLFSNLYDKRGWNLRSLWGVPIDFAIQTITHHQQQINRFVRETAFSHMTEKEVGGARRILSWMLDGSTMRDIEGEFGRKPTANEHKAAFMIRTLMGTKKGRGLHGMFNMEGFLYDYLPHMRKWREFQAELVRKKQAGEEITDKEWEELGQLHGYGLSGEKGMPNMKNKHALEREWNMREYEDDIYHILDRYVAAGLKAKYLEPIVKDIENQYGITFFRATGEWKPGVERDGVIYSERKNIGKIEKELLMEHIRKGLGYPTELELALNERFRAGAGVLQKIIPGKIPVGLTTFDGLSSTLSTGMYYGALGGRIASALKQLTGFPITVAELGPMYSALGVKELAKNPMAAFKRAADAGLFREFLPSKDKVSADARLERSKWKKFDRWFMFMFETADQSQRVIAYEGGKLKAQAMRDRLPTRTVRDAGVKNRMEKYKAEKNWDALAEEYGVYASHESQFKYGRFDSPLHFRTTIGRAFGMFMSWQLYFTGKGIHWATGGFVDANGKYSAKEWKRGGEHALRHLGPMLLTISVMNALARQSDVDLSPWFVQMFEVPDSPGPPARLAYDLLSFGNAGLQLGAAEILGSDRITDMERKQFKNVYRRVKDDLTLILPGSGLYKDIARANKWYDERGAGGVVHGLTALRPYEESE